MPKKSAGLLCYRLRQGEVEVLLVHPGGPFWSKKDAGSWSIPKGELEEGEEPLPAALREVKEETGIVAEGDFIELTPVRQKSGKIVFAWAVATEVEVALIVSNTFEMEWPPRSGNQKSFPEIDKADWFSISAARKKILEAQLPLLDEVENLLKRTK